MLFNVKSIFENSYNLNEKRIVENLEIGAKNYGGATKIDNVVYSNCNENNIFNVNEEGNQLGIIVPGSLDVDNLIDNKEYVDKVLYMLNKKNIENINIEGAWVMENGEVVIENNNLIKFHSDNLIQDLELLKKVALWIKERMNQEAVSVILNDGLIIC